MCIACSNPTVTPPNPAFRIGIIGGGVGGATLAEYLSRVPGVHVTLIEKKSSLVANTPFCHLHAGGLLYALNVPEDEARTLMYHSIRFAQWFPQCLARRPTVVGLRVECADDPNIVVRRCEVAEEEYRRLLSEGYAPVLGPPSHYFKAYSRQDLVDLRSSHAHTSPHDHYMAQFAHVVDLNSIQYPVVSVNEPGVAMVRVGAVLELSLADYERHGSVKVLRETTVESVRKTESGTYAVSTCTLHGSTQHHTFDYLVNSAGGNGPEIDALVAGLPTSLALAEVKAAYVVNVPVNENLSGESMPEIALLGTRGTPHGMVQITPYGNSTYQLHAMTKDATLFPGGLSACNPTPTFDAPVQKIVDTGFDTETLQGRSLASARHASQVLPIFSTATSADIPLWGVQVIAGDNAENRSGEAEFPMHRYAKLVIVKGISAVVAAELVIADIIKCSEDAGLQYELMHVLKSRDPVCAQGERLLAHAITVARARGFPDVFGTVGWEGEWRV